MDIPPTKPSDNWYDGSYYDLKKLTPSEIITLYNKHQKNIFYEIVDVKKEGSTDSEQKLELERIPLYLWKAYHAVAFADNDDLYIYDGEHGKYIKGETMIATWLENTFPELNSPSLWRDILHKLRSLAYTDRNSISLPANIIPFSNGNLIIGTDGEGKFLKDQIKLVGFSPEYFITNRLPLPYALGDCPIYENFMKKALDLKDIQSLNEFFGSMLIRKIIYPVVAWNHGPTKTGKSTLQNLVGWILGRENISGIFINQFNETFELASLENKLANIVPEMSAEYVKDSSKFKSAVAGDLLSARQLWKNPHLFPPTAKHSFAINDLPPVKDESDAFWDREKLIPWNGEQYIQGNPHRDPNLLTKLCAEGPAIVSSIWIPAMINAVNRGEYINLDPAEVTRERWLFELDLLGNWWNGSGLEINPDKSIPKDDVLTQCNAFLEAHKRPKIAATSLAKWLNKAFGDKIRPGKKWVGGIQVPYYHGIGYSDNPDTMLTIESLMKDEDR